MAGQATHQANTDHNVTTSEKVDVLIQEDIGRQLAESNVNALAERALTLRSKATYRLILVTFVWGLST